MPQPFTSPAAPEAFIAFQEQLINRPLTENEKEVTAVWLEIIELLEKADDRDLDLILRFIRGLLR